MHFWIHKSTLKIAFIKEVFMYIFIYVVKCLQLMAMGHCDGWGNVIIRQSFSHRHLSTLVLRLSIHCRLGGSLSWIQYTNYYPCIAKFSSLSLWKPPRPSRSTKFDESSQLTTMAGRGRSKRAMASTAKIV